LQIGSKIRAYLVSIGFVAVVVASASTAAGANHADGAQASAERTSVTLGQGKLGIYRWRSELLPAGKLHGGNLGSLCLNSVVIEISEASEFENCGPVLGKGRVEVSRAGTKSQPITVLSMVLKASATRVYLKRQGHIGRTFALRRLGVGKLTSISDTPLSTFAHAFGGPFCLERYVASDAGGNEVADSGRHPCSSV
jgi:hypothetical protein